MLTRGLACELFRLLDLGFFLVVGDLLAVGVVAAAGEPSTAEAKPLPPGVTGGALTAEHAVNPVRTREIPAILIFILCLIR